MSLRIYSGTHTSGGKQIGYVEADRIYSGDQPFGIEGKQIGYLDHGRIYRGGGDYGGNEVGYLEGNRVYLGSGAYGGKQLGYSEEDRIYAGGGALSDGEQVGYTEGNGNTAAAAGALLILLRPDLASRRPAANPKQNFGDNRGIQQSVPQSSNRPDADLPAGDRTAIDERTLAAIQHRVDLDLFGVAGVLFWCGIAGLAVGIGIYSIGGGSLLAWIGGGGAFVGVFLLFLRNADIRDMVVARLPIVAGTILLAFLVWQAWGPSIMGFFAEYGPNSPRRTVASRLEQFSPASEFVARDSGLKYQERPSIQGDVRVIAETIAGERLNIIGRQKESDGLWYQVRLADGQGAFIRASDALAKTPAPTGMGSTVEPSTAPLVADAATAPPLESQSTAPLTKPAPFLGASLNGRWRGTMRQEALQYDLIVSFFDSGDTSLAANVEYVELACSGGWYGSFKKAASPWQLKEHISKNRAACTIDGEVNLSLNPDGSLSLQYQRNRSGSVTMSGILFRMDGAATATAIFRSPGIGSTAPAFVVESYVPDEAIVVTGSGSRIRGRPSVSDDTPVIAVFQIGDQLNVVGRVSQSDWYWYQVRLADGRFGFIRSDLTSKKLPSP